MEIKGDRIEVATGATDEKGRLLEPEAQPARRVIDVKGNVQLSGGQQLGDTIPTRFVVEGDDTVTWAKALMGLCKRCIHFDNPSWRRHIAENEIADAMEDRLELNKMRAYLMETQSIELQDAHASMDGDMDVEHALHSMGICRAMTEIYRERCVVHPLGGCPPADQPGPHGEDLSKLFKPRDAEAVKSGASKYDAILRAAQGRKP
jgi:hypothetical protein